MNYGYDINDRPIKVISERFCDGCGSMTGRDLSNGTQISATCGCDHFKEIIHKNTEYVIVTDGPSVQHVTGYKEAKAICKEHLAGGDNYTLAEVVKLRREWIT